MESLSVLASVLCGNGLALGCTQARGLGLRQGLGAWRPEPQLGAPVSASAGLTAITWPAALTGSTLRAARLPPVGCLGG